MTLQNRVPADTPVATFYLGGQSYIFEAETMRQAGPELAEMAFFETHRSLWRLTAAQWQHVALPEDDHCLSAAEFTFRSTELLLGAFELRQLIARSDKLLPNMALITVH